MEQIRMVEDFVDLSSALRCGVYLLLNRGKVVYVGKSLKPFARLASHMATYRRGLRARQGQVKRMLFDQVLFYPCMLGQLDGLERELIAKHDPRYNTNVRPIERQALRLQINGRSYTLGEGAPVAKRQTEFVRRI